MELKSSSLSDLPAEPTPHEAMIAKAKETKGLQKPQLRKDRTAFLMGGCWITVAAPQKSYLWSLLEKKPTSVSFSLCSNENEKLTICFNNNEHGLIYSLKPEK